MANIPDPDIDDDFRDLYKEYTGPLGSGSAQEKAKSNKRSNAGSDEDDEVCDPNAIPTGFISRDAKVWEAKSKATERNWKKRKEEEMIGKLCGESGHFTQGCPSTLGANHKSQELFQRIPARDKNVRALFTEKVITKIERDIGCKIKMDEKFITVSRVDVVHKIREEGEQKGSSSSHMNRSRSPPPQRSVTITTLQSQICAALRDATLHRPPQRNNVSTNDQPHPAIIRFTTAPTTHHERPLISTILVA
ncbi:hypothetical protein RYX36_032957 [Vicia faba]